MADIKTVTVGKAKYNIVQAPAVSQKTLLTLIGARLAMVKQTSGIEEINIAVVKGLLLGIPETTFDEVADIVLYKVVKSGGKELISIEDFHNQMNDYLTLVAEAIKANLQDFFTWLDTDQN